MMKMSVSLPLLTFANYQESLEGLGFGPQPFLLANLRLLLLMKLVFGFHLDWFQQKFGFSKHVFCWLGGVQSFLVEENPRHKRVKFVKCVAG